MLFVFVPSFLGIAGGILLIVVIVEGMFLTFKPFDLGVDDFVSVSVVSLIRTMHLAEEGSFGFLLGCWLG
jgi:hypothetical protein